MKNLRIALIHNGLESVGDVEICSVQDPDLAIALLSVCIERSEKLTAGGNADRGDAKQLQIMKAAKEKIHRERSTSGLPDGS